MAKIRATAHSNNDKTSKLGHNEIYNRKVILQLLDVL